jgi:hypothetical protein
MFSWLRRSSPSTSIDPQDFDEPPSRVPQTQMESAPISTMTIAQSQYNFQPANLIRKWPQFPHLEGRDALLVAVCEEYLYDQIRGAFSVSEALVRKEVSQNSTLNTVSNMTKTAGTPILTQVAQSYGVPSLLANFGGLTINLCATGLEILASNWAAKRHKRLLSVTSFGNLPDQADPSKYHIEMVRYRVLYIVHLISRNSLPLLRHLSLEVPDDPFNINPGNPSDGLISFSDFCLQSILSEILDGSEDLSQNSFLGAAKWLVLWDETRGAPQSLLKRIANRIYEDSTKCKISLNLYAESPFRRDQGHMTMRIQDLFEKCNMK